VDGALLGTYLSGINTRRLRGALSPLLRNAPLSKDAVSRLVGRLRDEFTAWSARDLAAEEVCYLFLDGWYPRVRIGKKRARVPVLVTLGVCADGRRVVLDMRIAGQESEAARRELLQSLVVRHLGTPALAVIDGNPGLPSGAARAMAADRHSTLHQSQAAQPAGQGPGPPARGIGRGLPAHGVRRQPRGGRTCACQLPAQVATAL